MVMIFPSKAWNKRPKSENVPSPWNQFGLCPFLALRESLHGGGAPGALAILGSKHGRTILGRAGCTRRGWEFGRDQRTARQRENHRRAGATTRHRARVATH